MRGQRGNRTLRNTSFLATTSPDLCYS